MKVLLFTAPWCAVCKNLKPLILSALTHVHGEEKSTSILESVDLSERLSDAVKHQVQTVPTTVVLNSSGELVARFSGLKSREELVTLFESVGV